MSCFGSRHWRVTAHRRSGPDSCSAFSVGGWCCRSTVTRV